MLSILIAFLKMEDGQNIKKVLVRNGYEVSGVCTTGAQVVNMANELDEGIVICGYQLPDMHFSELNTYLPKGFEMLLIASSKRLAQCANQSIVCLSMPLKTMDFINTLEMMQYRYQRYKKKQKKIQQKQRSEKEKQKIDEAKQVLMERNKMSEEEAHRYIQKHSMDSGRNMAEIAEMILTLLL